PQSAAKARAMLLALREDLGLAKALLPAAQQMLRIGQVLHPQTLFFLAVLASRTHQLAGAEQFYRRCLDADRSPHREHLVYGGLIYVLWEAHKYEALVELCQQGLRQTQATNHLLFYDNLSQVLVLLGKMEEAVAAADKAVEISDEKTRLDARLLRLYV